MGLLNLIEGIISVLENVIEKLIASSPDATQMASLSNRISNMAASLDAAP